MSWFFILQLLACLLVGGLLARYFSESIRSLVVRLMPLEQRISEESFHIQARASTIIAAVLSLLLAGLLFWGLEQAKIEMGFSSPLKRTTQATLLSLTPELASPANVQQQQETIPEVHPEPPQPTPIPSPSSYDTLPKVVAVYYLQLGAYDEKANAEAEVLRLEEGHDGRVLLMEFSASIGRHKVLLGPFPSRQVATDYRRTYHMTGFVRKRLR